MGRKPKQEAPPPHRKKHEGSYRALPSGRIEGAVRLNRKRYYFIADTQEAAQKLVSKAVETYELSGVVPRRLSVADYFMNVWLIDVKRPHKGKIRGTIEPTTWRSYEQLARVHIKPYFEDRYLDEIQRRHCLQFLNHLRDAGHSEALIHHIIQVFKQGLGAAIDLEMLDTNPADRLKTSASQKRKSIEPFTEEEIALLFTYLRDKEHRLEAILKTAFLTGMREGELFGLRWNDLDFTHHRLFVRQAIKRVKGGWYAGQTKGKEERTLPIGEELIDVLKRHKARQKQHRLSFAEQWQDYNLVFPTLVGTPHEASNFSADYKTILELLHIKRRNFHQVRHSFATMCLRRKTPMERLSRYLGHKNIQITLDYYGHIDEMMLREVAGMMDNFMKEVR